MHAVSSFRVAPLPCWLFLEKAAKLLLQALLRTVLTNLAGALSCRGGIEQLNNELTARGFAMNEEGGILKVCWTALTSFCQPHWLGAVHS